MLDSKFTIYNASAGSGKTYTLAKAYLKIVLASENPMEFRHLLALTFTNKAVGEMKDRIINMLKIFSLNPSDDITHPMLLDICKELAMSMDKIQTMSRLVLKNILHNYGAFEITTIDAFNHRLIRVFAHDLRLPLNFEVELDQEKLLNEAVDRLISKAGIEKVLTKTLIDFSVQKTKEDKSWDIGYDLNIISGILLNENDLFQLEKIKNKTLKDFELLKLNVGSELAVAERTLATVTEKALNLIVDAGLRDEDFTGKYLPNFFKKLNSQNLDNTNFAAKWQYALLEGGILYPKRVSDETAAAIDKIQTRLAESFKETKECYYDIKFLKSVLQNLTPYSMLNLINLELNAIKAEKNLMIISQFNSIISNEIKDQPTPFIYERIGERFHHYFIDEFQDTSKLQWQNLIPLLDNSVSSERGSALIVGDAKQSIYRWRGSLPEQFIDLYNNKEMPFALKAKLVNLDTNYRSSQTVVAFNNSFFKFIATACFNSEEHTELYKNSTQAIHKNLQGLVCLKFLDLKKEDDRLLKYAEETLKTVNQSLKDGYTYNDICIITRKRKEGVAIAKILSENQIPITSSETLLLSNSPKVVFLNTVLRLLLSPSDLQLKIKALEFLALRNKITEKHAFYKKYLSLELTHFLKEFSASSKDLTHSALLKLPLYDLVEELIRMFALNDCSDAYLQFYLDEILVFVQKHRSDLAEFLKYFEEREDKLSVVVSDEVNAINIMTIHKSKGLEFPVVIFPFADLDIYREKSQKIWFPVNQDTYNGFEHVLINLNKDVSQYRTPGEQIYEQHRQQLALDNINLLYVVMTRAIDQLHVISKYDINSKGDINEQSFAGMFISYLQHMGEWQDHLDTYKYGEQKAAEPKKLQAQSEIINLLSTSSVDNNIQIISKADYLWDSKSIEAIERGNLVHLILSKIKIHTDIDFAFSELISAGDLNEKNAAALRPLVKLVLNHPRLESLYDSSDLILNEQDILLASGTSIRPDRINISKNNEITIIDYKTGSKESSHNNQLNDYAHIIETMGLHVSQKLLVYINDEVEIIEV